MSEGRDSSTSDERHKKCALPDCKLEQFLFVTRIFWPSNRIFSPAAFAGHFRPTFLLAKKSYSGHGQKTSEEIDGPLLMKGEERRKKERERERGRGRGREREREQEGSESLNHRHKLQTLRSVGVRPVISLVLIVGWYKRLSRKFDYLIVSIGVKNVKC